MTKKTATLSADIVNDFDTGENFESLLETSYSEAKKEGSVIKGTVIDLKNDFVIIDVGLKTEGTVSRDEFSGDVNVGDVVDVYLERKENREGEIVISRREALREESWGKYEEAHDKSENVDGVINGRVKGGFTVDLGGVIAFLPGSQVDIRPIKDISPLLGISQPFQILKMDRRQGNIVVSRRAIMEEERSVERDKLLSKIEEGQTLEGVVKNITDYGAFVDLGSIDGLLHVTDISWTRISHPSEVLTLGQTIKVVVIKYNEDSKRISLGMKQLEENPWEDTAKRYPVNARVKGKITNIADYGAFVELEPGIEGLVHISEISWIKNTLHPKNYFNIGDEIEVMVLDVDSDKHRISLGIKQCQDNPWQKFANQYPEGSEVEGEVKNVVDFGLFVGFDDGIDGLVHVSDLTWDDNPEEALKDYKRNDKVTMKVLSIDVDKERISLGVKQLTSDPFEGSIGSLKKGDVITCTVADVNPDGIDVNVGEEGVVASIKKNDLSRDRVEQRPERFAVGDRIDAKVTNIDKANRKVLLSIKALEIDEHKKAIAEYGSTDSGASLGDILGAALGQPEAEEAKEEKKPAKAKKAPAKKADKEEAPKAEEAKEEAPAAEEAPAEEEKKAE